MVSMFDYMVAHGIEDADCYDEVSDAGTAMSASDGNSPDDVVCRYILQNTQFLHVADWDNNALVGDVWSFAKDHYLQFVEFTRRHNNERFQMDDESVDQNLCVAVDTIICLHRGNYSLEQYRDFIRIFVIGPEEGEGQ